MFRTGAIFLFFAISKGALTKCNAPKTTATFATTLNPYCLPNPLGVRWLKPPREPVMKKLFYIDYPQERFEGHTHRYRCALCKEETTKINGALEGHLPSCQYRIDLEKAGYEPEPVVAHLELNTSDEVD